MSHKNAKRARRLARELVNSKQAQVDISAKYFTEWRPVTLVNRRTGKKVQTERPRVVVNPDSFDGLVNKLKKELA